MAKIILASKSPRRKELLGNLGVNFSIDSCDVDETIDFNNDLHSELKLLAYKKAKAVFDNNKDSIVIGSDTVVVLNDEVLGKPINDENAYNMLSKLSNNQHLVISSVCILSNEINDCFISITKVVFDKLSDEEINEYIATKDCNDKAGSYGIQGIGAKFIKGIEGDYYTVMGLPLNALYQKLKEYKII